MHLPLPPLPLTLPTGCHARTPPSPHGQPGGCRGMVHREARHAVDAMRGERGAEVVSAVCSVGVGMKVSSQARSQLRVTWSWTETRSSARNWCGRGFTSGSGGRGGNYEGGAALNRVTAATLGWASSHGVCISRVAELLDDGCPAISHPIRDSSFGMTEPSRAPSFPDPTS